MLEEYIPYKTINGIVVKYKNKKTGKIISNLEMELIKMQKMFGGKSV